MAETALSSLYSNVALKILASMQWTAGHLKLQWLLQSSDDDVAVNPFQLVSHLSSFVVDPELAPRPCYESLPLVCTYSFQVNDPPARNTSSKWYISEELYPEEVWPPYCRGGSYIMPVATAARLYEVSRATRFMHLDDVWVTGLMRLKLPRNSQMIVVSYGWAAFLFLSCSCDGCSALFVLHFKIFSDYFRSMSSTAFSNL